MLLIDNSAWARIGDPKLGDSRAEEIAGWIEEGELGGCLPFLLEVGYSARSAPDHRLLIEELTRLPWVELTPEIERAAIAAQGELALAGHHRLPPADVVIAACADAVGGGVLHYDRDYDLISEHTGLEFESTWLAPAGSL